MKIKNYSNYNSSFKTIGEFYSILIEKLWSLSDLEAYINKNSDKKVSLFSGDPSKQFTYLNLPEMA